MPSKTLIATADAMRRVASAHDLGVRFDAHSKAAYADLRTVNDRLLKLAESQSADIHHGLERAGVRVILGEGKLSGAEHDSRQDRCREQTVEADAILLATGATPRELPTAKPDGERIFNWTQVYNLTEIPEHLIVVGSGVTGAEFASAYRMLGHQGHPGFLA